MSCSITRLTVRRCILGVLLMLSSASRALGDRPSLPLYDQIMKQYLTPMIAQPLDNKRGNIVWNTRYYLESLLTAYVATSNPKYLFAFKKTADQILSLETTLKFLPPPDGWWIPLESISHKETDLLQLTGWPTALGTVEPPSDPGQAGLAHLGRPQHRPFPGPAQGRHHSGSRKPQTGQAEILEFQA